VSVMTARARVLSSTAGSVDWRFLGLCAVAVTVVIGISFGAEGARPTLTAVLEGLLGAILGGFAGAYFGKREADRVTEPVRAESQETRDRLLRVEARQE
jgi:hypothetical protein